MKVLITSKTRKGNAACVGGLVLENNKFIRLLNPGNWDQPIDTPFNIGDIWNLEFIPVENLVPPHIEDVIVISRSFDYRVQNIQQVILNSGVKIYCGDPNRIFDGLLRWTNNGSGYINSQGIPQNSVGFWIPDRNLILAEDERHYYYGSMNEPTNKRLVYVGFPAPKKIIPAGTLTRISLARWWKPEDADSKLEERCYLQLSGWYE